MSYLFNSLKYWVAIKIDFSMKADSDLWLSTILKEFIVRAFFLDKAVSENILLPNGFIAYWVAINNDNK